MVAAAEEWSFGLPQYQLCWEILPSLSIYMPSQKLHIIGRFAKKSTVARNSAMHNLQS